MKNLIKQQYCQLTRWLGEGESEDQVCGLDRPHPLQKLKPHHKQLGKTLRYIIYLCAAVHEGSFNVYNERVWCWSNTLGRHASAHFWRNAPTCGRVKLKQEQIFFFSFLSPVNLRAPVLLLRRPTSSINYGYVSDFGSLRRLMDKHKKNNVWLDSSVGGRRSVNAVRRPSGHVFFFFFEDNEFDEAEANEGLDSSCLTATHVQSCGDVFFFFHK